MKKLFVLALAAISMVACVNEDITELPNGGEISFGNAFINNSTRAAEDPSYTTKSLEKFNVWGYVENTSGVVFAGTEVTNNNGVATYTGTQYWAPSKDYYFAAIAGVDVDKVEFSDEYKVKPTAIAFTNENGTQDLIYAYKEVTSLGAGQDNPAVALEFNHILSKVKFSFTNGFPTSNVTVAVEDITMTAVKSANYKYDELNGWAWADHAGTTTLAFGGNDGEVVTTNTESANERLIIPTDGEQEYNIAFTIVVKQGGVEVNRVTKTSTISGVAFDAGRAYNLTAEITPETLGMDEIEFTVVVNDWDTTAPDIALPKAYVTIDGTKTSYGDINEAFAVAVAAPAAIVELNDEVAMDADNTVTIPEGTTIDLYLNGHTIWAVSDDSDKNDDGKLTSADNIVLFDVRGTMSVYGGELTRSTAAAREGAITLQHTADNFAWNACTEVFYVAFNGKLGIYNTTIENLGGSDMAYAIDLVNAKECVTLDVDNSTLKSSYIPVRVFNNNDYGLNDVTIANSTIDGKSRALWVHIYTSIDAKNFIEKGLDTNGNGYKDETLKAINIYNPEQNNIIKSSNTNPARIVEYGFTDYINFDEFGNMLKSYVDGGVIEAIYPEAESEFMVYNAEGLAWIADNVAERSGFKGQTVKLMGDIDLFKGYMPDGDPITTAPIGDTDKTAFEGTFDGQGNSIINLYQNGWALRYEWGVYGSIGLFRELNSATVKNLVIEDMEALIEGGDISFIAGSATGDCVFENITIKDSVIGTYNNGCGGIIGWSGEGTYTFKNITLESDVVLGGLWGSFDSSIGGIVGQADEKASYYFENCEINCRLDAYNDVTASYQWYSYRMCGMIIGRVPKSQQSDSGTYYPDPAANNVTCTNVVVNYGDWMNYHYCFPAAGGSASRVEAGYTYDGHDHNSGCTGTIECIPFDQIFGGLQSGQRVGYYGLAAYDGVTVNYPFTYNQTEVATLTEFNNAIAAGGNVKLAADINVGTTQLNLDKGQKIDLNGKTLTTGNGYGGILMYNGASIKNGTINHIGNTAAIKAYQVDTIEDVTINVTPTDGKVKGGIVVQRGAGTYIGSIKNVTITGVTNGVETYECGNYDREKPAIGYMENVNIDASQCGILLSAPVGTAKNCNIKGGDYGINMLLKGEYNIAITLENCVVEGGVASIWAHDEKGIPNTTNCSLTLTYDAATTLNGELIWDFEEECQGVVTLNRPN